MELGIEKAGHRENRSDRPYAHRVTLALIELRDIGKLTRTNSCS